ncbi:hypothetical protein, partial [Peribacillus butanolivorans]|uniref:hypothetical protein n=1 Tax=Peribacillus butanolivorans TaxID=421767 RepID=UPI0035DE04F3
EPQYLNLGPKFKGNFKRGSEFYNSEPLLSTNCRKIINFTFLFVFMLLLVGCMREDTEHLTRVDVQKIDTEGKYEEPLMITDNESIELLSEAFKQIKWDNRMVKMARKPDLNAAQRL